MVSSGEFSHSLLAKVPPQELPKEGGKEKTKQKIYKEAEKDIVI